MAAKVWTAFVADFKSTTMGKLTATLTQAMHLGIEATMTKLEQEVAMLNSTSGGAANGEYWWRSLPEGKAIDEHFKTTLERVDTAPIIRQVGEVKKVRRLMSMCLFKLEVFHASCRE